MRALVVYCHPRADSFTAAVRDVVLERLDKAGADVRLIDLYATAFDPSLSAEEYLRYLDFPANRAAVAAHCADLGWCDTLIFVYPTWWYGLPAMLKGWLDRVLLPEVAFRMPDEANRTIRPALTNIERLGVFTTCGASRWLTAFVGAPGKRTLLRGVRLLCAPRCRTAFAAHYLMDSSTVESRAAHLRRVARATDRLANTPRAFSKGGIRMIPLLDWRDFDRDPEGFSAELGRACRDVGFFLLKGHDVDEDLIRRVFDHADAFFALPPATKARMDIRRNRHNRGWTPQGSENLDDDSAEVDRKEAFNIGLDLAPDDPRVLAGEPFRAPNVWPDLPGFRDDALAYFDACLTLGRDLHRAIARDLDLPEDYFEGSFRAPLSTLRLLTYPPGDEGIGAGAHTDYGSLTLLMTDGEPGLQVRPRGGGWIDAPHEPGAFVVNIADCLMRWTNDIYVSTPHRVLPPKRRRRSLAFFLDPDPDAVIAALPGTGAPRYPPVTGEDYLRFRLDATYTPELT